MRQFEQDADTFRRYAIYYVPQPGGTFAEFGANWLGWDCATARPRTHPVIKGIPKPIQIFTDVPRRYGFHATLKAPFELADHCTFDALAAGVEALCAELPVTTLDGLRPSHFNGFVALLPQTNGSRTNASQINAIAAHILRGLDHFRAPLSADSMARRRAQGLTDRQDELLRRWGYPFVLEEFQFHMTLTGHVLAGEAQAICQALRPHLMRIVPGQVLIDSVALMGEDSNGMFRLIQRYALTGPTTQM